MPPKDRACHQRECQQRVEQSGGGAGRPSLLGMDCRPSLHMPHAASGPHTRAHTHAKYTPPAHPALRAVQVDPIDWATYESYLYANKDRFAARCQVGAWGRVQRGGAGGGNPYCACAVHAVAWCSHGEG